MKPSKLLAENLEPYRLYLIHERALNWLLAFTLVFVNDGRLIAVRVLATSTAFIETAYNLKRDQNAKSFVAKNSDTTQRETILIFTIQRSNETIYRCVCVILSDVETWKL